jgi:hypothetical protein
MKNNTQAIAAAFVLLVSFAPHSASADAVVDASRLLRVTSLGQKFESVAQRQTREILRTYSSIVSMALAVSLPPPLKQTIAECYAEVYAWENFEPGIAQILAENLSQKEIRLLIDFYRDLGLPPMEIQTFKDTIAKADQIMQISTEYILSNSVGCVDRDTRLILSYLANLESGIALTVGSE